MSIQEQDKEVQKAAQQYFQYNLPFKIVESICRQDPAIIKVTRSLLKGLRKRWKSHHTWNTFDIFRRTSTLWIQEFMKDPLVKSLITKNGGLRDTVLSTNVEFLYLLQLSNFMLGRQPFAAFVAFRFTKCKFKLDYLW